MDHKPALFDPFVDTLLNQGGDLDLHDMATIGLENIGAVLCGALL